MTFPYAITPTAYRFGSTAKRTVVASVPRRLDPPLEDASDALGR
jgi:hypothetical protein